MFKIKTRITDDIEDLQLSTPSSFDKEWNNASGFVQVTIGHHKLGYYHENPMQAGEWGGEWINWWLELFLLCAKNIGETKYIAFNEPESANKWLIFELVDDIVLFNIAIDEICFKNKHFISEKYLGFTYIDPVGVKINLHDFLREVNNAVEKFINDLKAINPKLMRTKMIKKLLELSESGERGG